MTVETTASLSIHRGNGVADEFDFNFKVLEASHLVVQRRVFATGVVDHTYDTDEYSVVGIGDDEGGSVTLNDGALSEDYEIIISREVPIKQTLRIGSSFLPSTIEDQLDRLTMSLQEVGSKADRAIRVPVGEELSDIPGRDDRASKYLVFDPDGELSLSEGTGTDTGLRSDLASNANSLVRTVFPGFPAIVSTLGDFLPTIAASTFFGIKSNGSDDDTTTLETAIAAMELAAELYAGGREIILEPGQTTLTSGEIVVRPGVSLNGRGGKIWPQLAGGNDAGVRLMSYSGLKNVFVDVVSSGAPGSQAGAHAAVLVGELYGAGGPVDDISEYATVRGAWMMNVGLKTTKDLGAGATKGSVGLQIMGDVAGCWFRGLRVPANDKMLGAVSIDWGTVGVDEARTGGLLAQVGNAAIVSNDAMMLINKANFLAGIGYTTHPHNNIISDVVVGALTRALVAGVTDSGTFAVRCSGGHGNIFDNIQAAQTTEATAIDHIGDVGYEYARDLDVANASHGNLYLNIQNDNAYRGYGLKKDSYADNVGRGATTDQYDPALNDGTLSGDFYTSSDRIRSPLYKTSTVFEDLRAYTAEGANAQWGANVFSCDGGELRNCMMEGFLANFRVSDSDNVKIKGLVARGSWRQNILIEDSSTRIEIIDTQLAEGANQGNHGGGANPERAVNFYIASGADIVIDGGIYGADATSDTCTHNLRINSGGSVTGVRFRNRPKILSHGVGSVAAVLGAGGGYGVLHNTNSGIEFGPNVVTKYAGEDVVPSAVALGNDGVTRREYHTNKANDLVGMDLKQGERIWYDDAVGGDIAGRWVVADGTVDANNLEALTKRMPALGLENRVAFKVNIPFIMPSSGTVGANGALSGIVNLPYTYPAAFVLLPLNAAYAGSVAGWYYTEFSGVAAGTIFDNRYDTTSGGEPAVPGVKVPIVDAGPGPYTATVAGTGGPKFTIPANTIGASGKIRLEYGARTPNNANGKTVGFRLDTTAFTTAILNSSEGGSGIAYLRAKGATNVQDCGIIPSNNHNSFHAPTRTTFDMTAARVFDVTLSMTTAATDYVVFSFLDLMVERF